MRIRALSVVWLPLAGLAQAATPTPVRQILDSASRAVEDFWEQLPAVNCVETVSQVRLGGAGKTLSTINSSFDYLVLFQLAGDDLVVEESRVPLKSPKSGKQDNLPLLVTNGFATFLFVFHRLYQAGFEYSIDGTERVDGGTLLKVRFRQIHGARSPTVLLLRQREYPVEWQGTAWLDPDTGSIARVSAGLASSLDDIGLKALSADVRYAPITFQDQPGRHWLPVSATIEAETPRQHWRNVHTFTGYKHFSVQTKTEVETPK